MIKRYAGSVRDRWSGSNKPTAQSNAPCCMYTCNHHYVTIQISKLCSQRPSCLLTNLPSILFKKVSVPVCLFACVYVCVCVRVFVNMCACVCACMRVFVCV